ncbi:MAG: hypothetical protein ACRDU4_05125 [Mycobacterium sp.]
MSTDQPGTGPRGKRDPNRRVIMVHCTVHGGAKGFTNLVISKRDGQIVMDPHATGGCVVVFDEKAAAELFGTIGEWLG